MQNDLYEIDFLPVETKKSGDAITLRYRMNGEEFIHVVDGGYQETGPSVVSHISEYYGNPGYIDHVVLTHPDGDHAGGLRTVLEEFSVGTLWMLRPWEYADVLLDRFSKVSSVENLVGYLREAYPNIVALEEIALEKGIEIRAPFQGAQIGAFTVLAPSPERYFDLIANSDRTPQSKADAAQTLLGAFGSSAKAMVEKIVSLYKAAWGEEVFSTEDTSAENEMSVIQHATMCGDTVLLTGDGGRGALEEAADFAPNAGITLPGVKRFQIPHHGSRRNVSTEILDRWLGERLSAPLPQGQELFSTVVSSAKEDEDHPRNSVVRAMIHRGASVAQTEGSKFYWYRNVQLREGWSHSISRPYPEEQEAD
ncbi:MAG: MBL fold metallo-hydrolase [Rhodobiaceae bacterium]|nr:MBL fold metallo-hydrolase [Rhodobiaceae bacterium]MCC0055014.1 MBL fold metallo-hydrolase [Rhodobiaceae bacterium]